MKRRSFLLGLLAGCSVSTAIFEPSIGLAQADNAKASMAALIAKTGALGAQKVEGVDPVDPVGTSAKSRPARDL